MARKLRIEYPGAVYHVMNRGDRREPIFREERDYPLFLKSLAEGCAKTQWQVHAFCLMLNHFHLVLETPQPNLGAGMKWFLGVYTSRFNRRHKLFGHLFSGRYKALLVEGSGNGYLKTACDYVHLNPARAKLLGPEEPLEAFAWSSYPLYLNRPEARPVWLRMDRLLGEHGIPVDSEAGRRQFAAQVELRRRAELEQEFKPLRRGWCLGSESFRKELLEQISTKRGRWHFGPELSESAEAKAERLIAEKLKAAGWREDEFSRQPKGSPIKRELAIQLRAETTMTLEWIAQRLRIGTRGHLAQIL